MQPQVPMQIAQPVNDAQLMILIAAMSPGDTPQEKVKFAGQLWGEALIQGQKHAEEYIAENCPEFVEQRKAAIEAAKRSSLVVPGPMAPMDFLKQRNRQA